MTPEERDRRIRLAAFRWLDDQCTAAGDSALTWKLLSTGFQFEGNQIRIAGQTGIFKPAAMPHWPLSIMTSPDGPYADSVNDDGLMEYAHRGDNPNSWDNKSLRACIATKVPLVYLYKIVKAKYLIAYPVFVVGENVARRMFHIEVDAHSATNLLPVAFTREHAGVEELIHRRYATVATVHRLHQQAFRQRVLDAYKSHCALCRLGHESLLDAAHIIPDNENGTAEVRNGLALCKIHHAAYDRHFLTIRPDYSVEVRTSLLEENDGPMLQHGLKAMHNTRICVPKKMANRPDRDFLAHRYERFLAATRSSR